ncbi:uncharacterized protein [Lolium perenne]|uniref:uncharacterized protein n=1 Tax=Lolium perenne TaxID=4522 RepID=UPI0021F638A1|nr:uncharacterized protein LOC127315620 [Lolium perenne]
MPAFGRNENQNHWNSLNFSDFSKGRDIAEETFYAEIWSGGERIGLDTYETAHEVARAYNAVSWRLGRPRRSMNFSDIWTRQQAKDLTPPPPTVTQEARQRELEQRHLVAERDECLRLEWARSFPEDVAAEVAFFAEKEEMKATQKVAKKKDR